MIRNLFAESGQDIKSESGRVQAAVIVSTNISNSASRAS